MYTCIHTCTYAYIHIPKNILTHIYTHIHEQANTYTNPYMHIHILKHISKFVHTCMHMFIYRGDINCQRSNVQCYNCQHSTSIEVQAIYTLLLKEVIQIFKKRRLIS